MDKSPRSCIMTTIVIFSDSLGYPLHTADSKIIRAFEIIRVKKLILNAVLWNKYIQIIIFSLYTVYNKHYDDHKNWQSYQKKKEILSQVLE